MFGSPWIVVSSVAESLAPSGPAAPPPTPDPRPVRTVDPWSLAIRVVVLVLAVGIGLWLLVTLRGIVLQVLAAVILATGLTPLVNRLERLGLRRAVAVLLIYVAVIVALVVFGIAVIPPIIVELDEGLQAAPRYGDLAAQRLRDLETQFPFLPPLDEQIVGQVRGLGSQVGLLATQALAVARFAAGVATGLFSVILILLITLYLTVDAPRVRQYFLSFLEPPHRESARVIAERIGKRMGGWLLGQLTLSLVVGLVSFVGLTVLGVPGAVLLAVIAAIGEAVPLVGPIVSAIPAVLVALGQSPLTALLTAVLYLMIQQLENNLLVPRIMGRAVNLHPLAVVLALVVGTELLGIAGALVAVPVAAAVAVLLDEVRNARATRLVPTAEGQGAPTAAERPPA